MSKKHDVLERLEAAPVIAAIKDKHFEKALQSPSEILFLFGAGIMTVRDRVERAHAADKFLFVHVDLAEGISKDKSGIAFLAHCGVDGIISTKTSVIRAAKECGLLTIQRFFAYDSQGVESIDDILAGSSPDIIEILPGVIGKIIERFANGVIPLIAGGLVETKQEVTTALSQGAIAVSTGKEDLWYL